MIKAVLRSGLLCLLVGCVGAPPQKTFDSTRRVQTIAVSHHAHIYAQDDVLLDDSLDKKLSDMNKNWNDDLSRASLYRGFSFAALIAQAASVGVCAAQSNIANVLAWCGGAVALGFGATIPLSMKAEKIRFGVVDQYNKEQR